MNLSLSDVLFVGFIIVVIAGLLAGLGELRDWLDEGRKLDRVQRLAALDNAARTPVRREDHGDPRHWPACEQAPIGDLVVNAEFERIMGELHYDSVRDMLDGGDDAA